MQDIVFPDHNEAALIARAQTLGIKQLVFVYSDPASFYRQASPIPITNALITGPLAVERARQKAKFVLVKSSDKDVHLVEHSHPTLLFDLESSPRHDALHQRASGLNHVLARLCAKNQVAVAFSFRSLLETHGERRAQLLGRMTQNISLCRKFKVPLHIASFAASPAGMRNPDDLKALFVVLGMHPSEASSALH
ncbi:MAG TPA: RNase P subunit p30 family protein [Candidatus Binatia bacterium]|nr:RNase P subunit p30 family protein [Candidatus Binatia bacterium]